MAREIFGKPLKDYIEKIKDYALCVFIVTLLQMHVTALALPSPELMAILTGLLRILIVGWAGWTVVREHDFNTRQTAFVGALLFLAAYPAYLFSMFTKSLIAPLDLAAEAFAHNAFLLILPFSILAALVGGWAAKNTGEPEHGEEPESPGKAGSPAEPEAAGKTKQTDYLQTVWMAAAVARKFLIIPLIFYLLLLRNAYLDPYALEYVPTVVAIKNIFLSIGLLWALSKASFERGGLKAKFNRFIILGVTFFIAYQIQFFLSVMFLVPAVLLVLAIFGIL